MVKLALSLLVGVLAQTQSGGMTGGVEGGVTGGTGTGSFMDVTTGAGAAAPGANGPPIHHTELPTGAHYDESLNTGRPAGATFADSLAQTCPFFGSCCKDADASLAGTFHYNVTSDSIACPDTSTPKQCRDPQLAMMCLPCSTECQGKEILNGPPMLSGAGAEAKIKSICEDTTCATKMFKSMTDVSNAMMNPDCQTSMLGGAPAASGAPADAAKEQQSAEQTDKMTDQFAFFCTKNEQNKYCMLAMSPEEGHTTGVSTGPSTGLSTGPSTGPPPTAKSHEFLSCDDPLIKQAKEAGCCFGSMMAQAINDPFMAGEMDSILEMAKKCELSLTPCTEGSLLKVAIVEDEIELPLTAAEIKKDKAAVKKAIATSLGAAGVTDKNVMITGIGASTSSSRHLTAGTTVNYAVSVPQKAGVATEAEIKADTAKVTSDALTTNLKSNGVGGSEPASSSSGVDPMIFVGAAAGLMALIGLILVLFKVKSGNGAVPHAPVQESSTELEDSSRQVV